MVDLADPQAPLTNLKTTISTISKTTIHLLNILKRLDTTRSPVSALDVSLHTFQRSLILFSYHVLFPPRPKVFDQEWCSITSFVSLLENAQQCFSRLDTIFVDSMKSEFSDMRRYLKAQGLDGVVRQLTLRVEIYELALGMPILASALHVTHEELGPSFREMGFKTVERWGEQLSRNNSRLAEYDEISIPSYATSAIAKDKVKATSTSQNLDLESLNREGKDLVQIIALMIGNTMAIVKTHNDNSDSTSSDEEISTTTGCLNSVADEQPILASENASAPKPPSHLAHIIRSARDVVGTRATPISTLHESMDTCPSVSLSPVSPLEDFYRTANVVTNNTFVIHRNETIKSESASLPELSETEDENGDEDEGSEEYHVEASYEYLHLGPDSLFRTDVEGGWRVT